MPFLVLCRDKPGALDLRKANRDAHLAFARESGLVAFGGPMLDDAGGMCGSMLVLATEDRAAADAFLRDDPYARAGLFDTVEVKGFKQVFG